MDASNITTEQIATLRAFLAFIEPMDGFSTVEAIDRLTESETDDEFRATLASIEEEEGA